MSESVNDSKNPVLSLLGTAFLFLVPAALIVMMGFVGVAFLGGSGLETADEETAEEATPAAPATVAATTDEPAPATEVAAATPETPSEPQPAAPASDIDPDVMALGKVSYATCAACHGPDGQGLKAGPMLMAPTLTGSELLMGDPDAALLILMKGIAKENMDYMGMMASLGAALDDEKMAAVLTYTRNAFGNSGPAITAEQAAAARAKFADVNAPAGVKRSEIPKILEEHK